MTFKCLLRAVSAGALGTAMALGAVPASAQEDDYGDGRIRNGQRNEQQQREQQDARSEVRQQQRQERQAARAAAAQPAPQAAPQQQPSYQDTAAQQHSGGDWNRGDRRSDTATQRSGRDWNRRDNTNNDWGQARAAHAQAQAQAAAQIRSQGWDGRRRGGIEGRSDTGVNTGSWERNRTYGDAARNTTYRDGNHDGHHAGDGAYGGGNTGDSYRHGYRDASRGYRPGDGHHQWNRGWRGDNRYNWYGHRSSNRDIYRLGRYYAPYSDYRYNRVSIGFQLGSLFFGSRYWINDPWQYRLPAAYGPYRWVRYYDDALLVDTYSGQVVDVIHDFFW